MVVIQIYFYKITCGDFGKIAKIAHRNATPVGTVVFLMNYFGKKIAESLLNGLQTYSALSPCEWI